MVSVEQRKNRSDIEKPVREEPVREEPAIEEQLVESIEPMRMMSLPSEVPEVKKAEYEKNQRQSENKMFRAYNIELNNEINTKVQVLEKEIEDMRENYEKQLAGQKEELMKDFEKLKDQIEKEKTKSNRFLSQITALQSYNTEIDDEVEQREEFYIE